jgi:LCP family protein required for cell wall assembly
VPGVGQLAAGARKRGYILLGVVVAVLVAFILVVLLAREDVDEFSAWLLEPSLLVGLLIADIVLLLFRLYAVLDAVRARRSRWTVVGKVEPDETGTGRMRLQAWLSRLPAWPTRIPHSSDRSARSDSPGDMKFSLTDRGEVSRGRLAAAVAGLVVILGFTAFPHVWFGYNYLYKAYDALTTVFVVETTTSSSLVTTTTEDLYGGSGTTDSTTPLSTTTTVPPATVNAGDDGRLTILFLGSDAGVGRAGARSDTIIVASFNLDTGHIALFSLPRNAGDSPLSETVQKVMGMRYYPNWLTGLYGSARRYPELAPEGGDPGAVAMRDTVSIILGVPIDYYAVVDMLGFVNLVDILGGVKVYLDKPLHTSISPPTKEENTLVYDLDEGVNYLDGRMALAFARTRHDSTDYVRMGRQRCVIAAIMDQTGMSEMIWNFPAIMDVIKSMVRTDIPIDALQQLVKLRSSLKTDEMITVGFTPPKYTNGTNGNSQQLGWILDYKLIRSTVKQILEHPEEILAEEDSASDLGQDSDDCWKKARE